jgi:hypothetical protein
MAVNPNDYGATGDGSANDGAAVALAMAAAASLGNADLYLPPDSIFKIDGYTIEALSGQRFFGGGALRMGGRTWALPSDGSADAPKLVRVLGKTGVKFEGIKFEFMGADDPRVYGVTIQQSVDCEVTGCDFNAGITSCFLWRGTSGTKFIGNRTHGGNFGIATGGDGAGNTSGGSVSDTIIADNHFVNAISEGIDINWDTVFCTISGNHLSNNRTVHEEEIDIGGGNTRDIIVTGNIIDGGGRAAGGVNVKSNAKYVKIANNILRNFKTDEAQGAGITFAYGALDGDIIGNTIYSSNRGIWARYVGGSPSGLTIALNRISNFTSFGVYLQGTAGDPLKNIRVIDNKIDGATTGQDGLLADHASELHITGNRSERSLRGMRFGTGLSGHLQSNNLKGNSVAPMTGSGQPGNWTADSIISDNIV